MAKTSKYTYILRVLQVKQRLQDSNQQNSILKYTLIKVLSFKVFVKLRSMWNIVDVTKNNNFPQGVQQIVDLAPHNQLANTKYFAIFGKKFLTF